MKWWFVVLATFAVIGAMVSIITIHELTHYADLKSSAYIEGVCVLNLPINSSMWTTPAGYVLSSPRVEPAFDKAGQVTEIHAYAIMALVLAIFLFAGKGMIDWYVQRAR